MSNTPIGAPLPGLPGNPFGRENADDGPSINGSSFIRIRGSVQKLVVRNNYSDAGTFADLEGDFPNAEFEGNTHKPPPRKTED